MNIRLKTLLILFACSAPGLLQGQEESGATKRLKERNREFRKDIIRVTEGVYTAVGYDVSTVSMIVGDDGLIIVDTGQAVPRARETLQQFRKLTNLPISAVILTHGHGDHTGGLSAFVDGGSPEIWARENFGIERSSGIVRGSRPVGAAGMELPPELRINNGIAPAMYRPARSAPNRGNREQSAASEASPGSRPVGQLFGQMRPNRLLDVERKVLEIAGVQLELVAAPGETRDQLYVWVPERKVLFAGDNFYRSFPNIYPLRGVRRSALDWSDSLTKMIREEPEFLVGGHTRPVIGRADVEETLGNYQAAVQYVYDETLKGMAQGMTPDELVASIRLPEHLANQDYLADYYGAVSFTIRAIYSQSVGWFDGNPTNINPLPPKAEAERMADMAGGQDKLLQQAKLALSNRDAQWAAQLTDYLLALDRKNPQLRELKADALTMLADGTFNAPSRNYYLAYAQYLREQP